VTITTAFLNQLKDLCTNTITYRAKDSLNNYGEIQYSGATASYSAYIQYLTSNSADVTREEYVAEYKAYIPSASLSPQLWDEFTFPDGTVRPVVEVDLRRDEFGQQMVVIGLGRARGF